MPKLELYYKTTCSYCHKVVKFMEQNGIAVSLKNVYEPANRDELIKIGGSSQVPCLTIDGQAMYESDDIIDWLKENYKL